MAHIGSDYSLYNHFSLSYGSHYFILRHHLTMKQQLIYEFYVTMIWISYLLAIYTNPGRVPKIINHLWRRLQELNKPRMILMG